MQEILQFAINLIVFFNQYVPDQKINCIKMVRNTFGRTYFGLNEAKALYEIVTRLSDPTIENVISVVYSSFTFRYTELFINGGQL